MTDFFQAKGLVKNFPIRAGFLSRVKGNVQAVRDVSFSIPAGQTLGLVGESGCGKTTVARLMARLLTPDAGRLLVEGEDVSALEGDALKPFRKKIQMIFQDPFSSLNPRMRVEDLVAEPLVVHGMVTRREKRPTVQALMEQVGLPHWALDRYPHEFSGGQRQRIGIARALALLPKLIICDEPVSALDVSVAAQIVNLLQDLQDKWGLSYLFISHDLKMVKYLSHRISVMYLGEIVESAPKDGISEPLHPYAQALMNAIPVPDPWRKKSRILLPGEVPSPAAPPPACSFHTRCPYAEPLCRETKPDLKEWRPQHWAACHFVDEIQKGTKKVTRAVEQGGFGETT